MENKVRHKWVTEVEMLQEIPKSASGKILRRVLGKWESENDGNERYMVSREEVQSKL